MNHQEHPPTLSPPPPVARFIPLGSVSLHCRDCRGTGRIQAITASLPHHERLVCRTCNGSGRLSPRQASWIHLGNQYRHQRVQRGETPSIAAERLGLSVRALLAMEQGRANPAPLLRS